MQQTVDTHKHAPAAAHKLKLLHKHECICTVCAQKDTHLNAHTPCTRMRTYSEQLLGIWSSKDALFWEQLWVSHPTLVTDGETGCKYQTLYKHCDTQKHPPTLTQTHTQAHTLTFLAFPPSLSLS